MASIRERRSKQGEKTWAVLYRHGGKQTSTTFETAQAASDFKSLIDLIGVDKALATQAVDTSSGLTVNDLFDRWIAWKATTDVTARTLKDYRRDYDNWVRDKLGHRHADTIDELDVQGWVDWMAGRLDPKSVGDRHMILGSMFRFGVARSRRLVEHNPCLETQLPSKKKKAPKGFTRTEWEAMHAWGAEHEPDADDLLLFVVSTGWRFSEVTPLIPAAVEDYGDRVAHLPDGREVLIPVVFVSVLGVHRRDEDDRTVYVDREGKSHAAIRRANLPPAAARMIRRRLVGKGPADLVFTNRHGSQWRSNNFLDREFQNILDGAGITKTKGMGPHYLRHSQVGMLDHAGVSLAKMQRRIGHENISTTLGVYGGMIDNSLSDEELLALDEQIAGTSVENAIVQGEVVSPRAVVAGTPVRPDGDSATAPPR